MPTPIIRPSLTTDLASRYANQPAGGAFDVKKTLNGPGASPDKETVIEGDTISRNAQTFQSPAGFETNPLVQESQFINVQTDGDKGVSRFLKGFSNVKYKP